MVVDHRPGPAYDRVGAITHGPGGRLAYLARSGDQARIVLDGVEGPAVAAVHSTVFDLTCATLA